MLRETLNQPLIFVIFLVSGFLCGLIFDIKNLLTFLCKQNKIVHHILSFIATLGAGIIYLLILLMFNYGEQRLYPFITYIVSLLLERSTLGNLLAKTYPWCYIKYTKLSQWIKRKIYRDKSKEKFKS